MSKFTLAQEARIKTAGGEAHFAIPGTDVVLGNELGNQWLTLPVGTEVEVCAAFPKTHTWMLAVTQPEHIDEDVNEKVPAITNGIVLRKLAFDNVVAATQAPEVEEADDAEEAQVEEAQAAVG